jgi:hypothetical protein
MRAVSALVVGALAGCYNPALQDCAVTCVNNACPSGFQCVAGVCRSSSGDCPGSGSADADLSGFAFRKKISIRIVPGGQATNFPLSIRRGTDPDLANFAGDDGSDILFTTTDGTELASDIERFDGTTGELVAWVLVPTLIAPFDIYMYFGNSMARGANPTAVWDANYIGVWHLFDPPGNSVADATAAALAAQKTAPPGPAPTLAGMFGNAAVFGGVGAESLSIGNSAAVTPPDLTFESWINYTDDGSDTYRALFVTPNAVPNHPSVFYPNGGTQASVPKQSIGVAFGGQAYFSEAGSFAATKWNHVLFSTVGQIAGSSLYINGVKQTLVTTGFLYPSGSAVTFGGLGGTQLSMSGSMDEIRYSKSIRDQAYATASYAYGSNASFVTFGPVETVP